MKHLFIAIQMAIKVIFDMKYKFNCKMTAPKTALKIACCLVAVFTIHSCINDKTKSEKDAGLPVGKWKAIRMQNKVRTLILDTNKNYFFELDLQNKMIVSAEDNTLSGFLIDQPSDSLKIENIVMTDVCCNTDTANILFGFFYGSVKYLQQGKRLTLSSEKGVLELIK